MRIARVSKLNGRRMMVAGSSFITSTNTSMPAVSRLPHISGVWTLRSIAAGRWPRVRAAQSMFGVTLLKDASTVLNDTARKRTR